MEAKERRNFPGINIKDIKGLTVPFVFNYGIQWNGANYNYNVNVQPEGFFLIPLNAGTIEVQLYGQLDSDTYVISAAEITAYIGKTLPYRIKRIIAGVNTTVTLLKIVY